MAEKRVVQRWTDLPTNAKTFAILFIIGVIVLAVGGGLYEYAKHSGRAQLDFSATKEVVTCSDDATNPGFNFPVTLANPGSKPIYWSVTYAPHKPTTTTHSSVYDRVRVVLAGGTLLISTNQNIVPARGQTTINVHGYVDEAWTITFSYSTDQGAITPQTRAFSLVCG